jgi:hypothetical protein
VKLPYPSHPCCLSSNLHRHDRSQLWSLQMFIQALLQVLQSLKKSTTITTITARPNHPSRGGKESVILLTDPV